jgi:hypothetical protein
VIHIPQVAKLVCPHCRVAFKNEWNAIELGHDQDGHWLIRVTECTSCERLIVMLNQIERVMRRPSGPTGPATVGPLAPRLLSERMIWPKASSRTPIPSGVPREIAEDYTEACTVLPDSAKASAALSRRCLQNLLVAKAGVTKKDLFDQIQEVLDARTLPSSLAEDLDAVRNIGNFGAHPIKSKSTGEIVPVEPGEAEWNLEVLDALFDFFYAQPEKRQERRAALDEKLKAAGKPTLAESRKKKS